ncbi:MAG TPA: aerial mycelium formation protein [Actinomycetota bacterium]|nr:aerial mycelium formation protein [Actinomycetota bacterium]
MTEPTHERRLVDRVADPSFVDGLGSKPLDELRAMRDACRTADNEVSFERRLCQARIDILSAELSRRQGGGDEDLLSRLPEILATEGRAPTDGALPERAPDFSIPRTADVPRRRVEEIAGETTLAQLPQLSGDEVRRIIESLGEHERSLSERRKRVHDAMDAIQDEIVRRYVSGEADPSEALG